MVRSAVVVVVVAALSCPMAGEAAAQTPPRPAAKKPATAPTAKAPAAPAVKTTAAPPKEVAPPTPPTDVRVVTAYTQGAQVSVNTTYIAGARQRVEFPGLVSLDQCDLQRTVLMSPTAKRYRVQPDAPPAPVATAPAVPDFAAMAAAMGVPMPAKSGLVTVTTTLTDTLERQTMFGLEARHIKTVVTRQTSGDVCDKTPLRTDIDAWYIDLPKTAAACSRKAPSASESLTPASDACQDRTETRFVGDVTLGFPVKTVTTNLSGEGDKQESSTTVAEVTALEISRLDRALFEVPGDFVEAKSMLELTPAVAAGATLADALFGSTADGTSQAAPKRAGIARIGVLEPVNKSARSTMQMRALRQELVTHLTKAPFEALPLSGSSPQAIAADMKRLECDYVLLAEVTEVKTSKPGKLSMMTGASPGKDHHEVKMSYRLYPADGTATIAATGQVKADNGGGFGLRSALRVAAFAGQLYMGFGGMGMMRGFGGMGGMGMGMGMMNPMYAMSGGGGAAWMSGFMDPRARAMTGMATGFGSGLGGLNIPGMPSLDPSEQEVFKVAGDAAGDIAKGVTDSLKRGKS